MRVHNNASTSPGFYVHKSIRQSTDRNVGRDVSVVNQPTPLPLNDDTDDSIRNGVSVSESEVSSVLGMSNVACK